MSAPVPVSGPLAGELVWVKGLRGPVAEKWPPGALGTTDKVVLARHRLGRDEYALSIAILEQRYPPPVPQP